MVKGINVEFRKEKKEEDGATTRKKRKRDNIEEEAKPVTPAIPFNK
jgi:hypothetical protein